MSASTSALQQKNAKHLIQSFSDLSYIKNPESTHIISRADGVYIYDNDGKKILDSMSGLWCVNMGYGQHSIIDAVNEQMKELVYYNNFFGRDFFEGFVTILLDFSGIVRRVDRFFGT